MESSAPNPQKRDVLDVHVKRPRAPRRGLASSLAYGKNVLNLRPGFGRRHPILALIFVVFVSIGVFFGIKSFFLRAEVKDFFPITCLGNWQNPSYAQGQPESLNNASGTVAIDASDASVFDPTSPTAQIFCGAFVPPDFQPQGDIKSVGLTLVWNIPAFAPTSTPVDASTSTGDTSVPPTSAPTGTSAGQLLKTFTSLFNIALADDTTDTVSTTPAPSDTSTPAAATPPPTGTLASSSAPAPTSDSATSTDNNATTTTSAPTTTDATNPAAGGGTAASATSTFEATSTTSSTSEASSTAPVVISPQPDDHFLKVSYSLDGQTWLELTNVGADNWQNFTATLPVTSWSDLQKLQVKIEGIPTTLAQIPKVFLDGMFIETHYEIPPIDISLGGPSAPAAGNTSTSTVVVVPPSDQPVPVNQNNDFKASESPTFDFNLNALPSATSSPASSPPASDTSTPTSFAAPSAPLSFFFRAVERGVSWLAEVLRPRATAYAQSQFPDQNNPVVAQIFGPDGNLTDFQAVTLVTGGNLRIILPSPGRSFRPGSYTLKLLIWQNGVVYATESNFSWGVLAANFDKSIYTVGDTAHAGFAVLDDGGRTICDAAIDMDMTSPSGIVSHFSTLDKTIKKSSTCGAATVTNNPDYSTKFFAAEAGTYTVSVVATTANGTRKIADQFQVQNPPLFDVARSGPTRIYPPVNYTETFTIKANSDFQGQIMETVPNSFVVMPSDKNASVVASGDAQTISWPATLHKGDSLTLSYSFKAPNVSPALYKLGPLQIGSWQEARQWQIAADAISDTVLFITSIASTSWTVPNDWNNASNSIEVIGAGGGGGRGTGTTSSGGGGGGGAYAKTTNFSTSTGNPITIQVGKGGIGAISGGAAGTNGSSTFFNWSGAGATSTCSASLMTVCAQGGNGGAAGTGAGTGGASSTSVGSTTHAGGRGGTGGGSGAGGGGGGAGGPNSNGNYTSAQTTTTGGQGDGTSGGAGGTGGNPGTGGATSTEWTATSGATAGAGGGGGGGSGATTAQGGPGGSYGGGGGGGSRNRTDTNGTGANGLIVIQYTPVTITLGDGTQQASSTTIAPSAATTTNDIFTMQTNFGTSSISNVTVNISTSTGIFQVQVTNASGTTVYGSSTNPGSTSLNVTTTNMNVSTTLLTFNVLIKPLTYANMPSPHNVDYTVTSTISAWTDSKSLDQAGGNTTSSITTIDNSAPADVTGTSGSISSGSVTLNWTNPGDADFTTTTVLRATSSVTQSPTNGTNYAVGNTIGTSTVACVVASSTANCTDSGLTNGTAYYYKIFTEDNALNYSGGVVPTGNPFTPSNNTPPSVSKVVLNGSANIVLNPATTKSITVVASTTAGSNPITYATSTIYRSGVSGGAGCSANNRNCYQIASSSCSFSNSTTTVSCSANLQYFADATDSSSSFNGQTWQAAITAGDGSGNTNTSSTATGVTLQTLLAINITTSSINYGTVIASSTGGGGITTTVQNAGNCSTTLNLSGTQFVSGSNNFATTSQHYATSSFTFGTGDTTLTDAGTSVSGFLLIGPTSTNPVQSNVFWAIGVPGGVPTGTYNATTTFTAVFHS